VKGVALCSYSCFHLIIYFFNFHFDNIENVPVFYHDLFIYCSLKCTVEIVVLKQCLALQIIIFWESYASEAPRFQRSHISGR
jgi:hypothetical protein